MYQRITDSVTGLPAFFYATDEHNKACRGYWYKAKIVDNGSSHSTSDTICWTRVGVGAQGPFGIRLLNLDTGILITNAHLFAIQDKATAYPLEKLAVEAADANAKLWQLYLKNVYSVAPHP